MICIKVNEILQLFYSLINNIEPNNTLNDNNLNNSIKCDYPDCNDTVKSPKIYCNSHECMNVSCDKKREKNKYHCYTHSCLSPGCNLPSTKITLDGSMCVKHKCDDKECTNLNETISPFCEYHKCYKDDCVNHVVKDGHPYCYIHGCNSCGDRLKGFHSICVNCMCNSEDCSELKMNDKLYCDIHSCYHPDCKREQLHNNLCPTHFISK